MTTHALAFPVGSRSRNAARCAGVSLLLTLFAVAFGGCGPAFDAEHPARTPLADKWLTRAKLSYKAGDFADASDAAKSALQAAPSDPEIKTLAARIALAKLDFGETLKLTAGLQTTEVHSLRGRAHWFSGDIEQAADELEAMLQDPAVRDPWATEVAKLARLGTGRHPFAIEDGYVASIEMPQAGPALIVPCELEGESILALVATASSEVVIDSATRHESAWVNLKFGDRLEVKDVPALTQDLSGVSHELGAPIKALLGANLLRHVHATFDRRGDQFVVRRDEAPPPPDASRVPLWYVRGGGMFLRAGITPTTPTAAGTGPLEAAVLTPLLVDTTSLFPVALQDSIFARAGVDLGSLHSEPGAPNLKTGTLPSFRLGAFDLPKVPAVEGAPMGDILANVDLDMGGVIGAGLLSVFRVTFGDDGRFIWIEPDPLMMQSMGPPPPDLPVSGAPRESGTATAVPPANAPPPTTPAKGTATPAPPVKAAPLPPSSSVPSAKGSKT
jgi:hypothetical protein